MRPLAGHRRGALVLWLMAASLLAAKDNTITPAEAKDGWVLLFDGESLSGWSQDNAKWKAGPDEIVCDSGECGLLRANTAFADYVFRADFRSTNFASNAGVLFRFSRSDKPDETGYDVRLGNSDAKWPAGSVSQLFRSDAGTPSVNQWHTLELNVSGDEIAVKIDGRKVASGKDGKSLAGYIGLAVQRGGRYEFRNIKLKPLGLKPLFTGTDLSGWKTDNPAPPKPGGGVFKKIGKVFGGSSKAHEASWTLVGAAIHGEKGPGALETQTAYDDFLLQIDVRANSKDAKKHPRGSVSFRGDAGQLGSGYQVAIENSVSTGSLTGLKTARRVLGTDNEFFTQTVAARGRHFQIWVNGYPVTEFDDPRVEGASPKKEARSAAGVIALAAPEEGSIDFRNIQAAALPKTLGGQPGKAAAAAPPPPVAPVAPPVAAPALPAPPQPQAPPVIIQAPGPDPAKEAAKQAEISKLTLQALESSDPKTQMPLYEKILALDPNNVNAAQGFKDAQQKIAAAAAIQQQTSQQQALQSQQQEHNAATVAQALQLGQAAFLRGDLSAAQAQVDTANKIAPGNDQVRQLKQRVDGAVQTRNRQRILAGAGGGIVLIGVLLTLLLTRGKKDPYLEVVDGFGKGKRFNLDQEIAHIGAVPQDGGRKNEIVLQDAERMISRFHCEIHNKGGKLFLIDCQSANGTRLDRHSVAPGKPMRLKSGSRIELGGTCTLRVGFEKRKTSGPK